MKGLRWQGLGVRPSRAQQRTHAGELGWRPILESPVAAPETGTLRKIVRMWAKSHLAQKAELSRPETGTLRGGFLLAVFERK